jgi:flagellin-like protein
MNHNNFKSKIGNLTPQKRRGVAEVISTLLLVAITVAGAVVLTSFIDESFVSGSLAVTSGTDTTIKTIRLLAYDTRNGDELMGSVDYGLDNRQTVVADQLCRIGCEFDPNTIPTDGGSNFMIIQIENRGIHPIFVKNVILDGVDHTWDSTTVDTPLNFVAGPPSGDYPLDGQFSVLPSDTTDTIQGTREIAGGQAVNLLVKLDTTNPDIQLSKTVRAQINIGENTLADFLIETGDAR